VAAAKITVERRRRYVGSASAFRVMLDGIEQGRLRPGDQLTFEAMPGAHQVYVTTDGRVRSRPIEFDLSPGQHAQILSSSPGNPVGNLYRIFFQPGETLEIELAGRQGSQQLGERQDG
jgi:hypothetical protein